MEGHFGHHVRRMRQTYGERASVLREAASKRLKGLVDVVEPVAGMRTLGLLETQEEDTVIAARGRSLGLELTALSEFAVRSSHPAALILGFAACNASELRRGVGVLATVLESKRLRGKNAS